MQRVRWAVAKRIDLLDPASVSLFLYLRLSATSMDAVFQAHLQDLLTTAVLLIGASAAAIVLSRRVGLGSVLGLIVVGVIIGPYTPGPLNEIAPVGGRGRDWSRAAAVRHPASRSNPQRLWAMRRMLFGLGTLQVLASGVVLSLVGLAFGGPWPAALIAGFGLSLSSTAFVPSNSLPSAASSARFTGEPRSQCCCSRTWRWCRC